MRSLYYKSLNAHMRNFRKGQNMQEMNDQLHNINLKEELNRELNKENAVLAKVANDLKRDEIKKKYEYHLGQHKEKKLEKKAEKAAKSELLKEEAKTRIQNKKLPIITPAKVKAYSLPTMDLPLYKNSLKPHPYRASRIGTKLKNLSYSDIIKRTRAPSSATSIQSESVPMVDLRQYNKGRPKGTEGYHFQSKAAKKRERSFKRHVSEGGLKHKINTLI